LDFLFVLNDELSKSSYEKFDKSPGGYFSSHRPVFERFEYLITGPPNLQITDDYNSFKEKLIARIPKISIPLGNIPLAHDG
jgi:hypothetical protein